MFSRIRLDWLDRRSLRFRLTWLFSVILAGALVTFSFLLYRSFAESHRNDFDIALYNHAVDISNGIDINAVGQLVQTRDPLEGAKIFPFSLSRTFMQIRSADGRVLAVAGPVRSFDLPFSQRDFSLLSHGRDSTFRTMKIQSFVKPWPPPEVRAGVVELEDESYRLINFPLDEAPSPHLILQIAAPLSLFELQTANLRGFFFFAIPVALILAAVGGYFLAGRALEPVDAMVRKASAIGVDRLSDRLPVPQARDELQRLALTMNSLLERVEKAMASQERFIADASHQLMTPLAILRGELDVVQARDPDDVKRYLASASQEVDRLSRTVRDMLLLARADAGRASLSFTELRMDEILLEATERIDMFAERRGVRLRVNLGLEEATENDADGDGERALETRGDRDLLLALFQNLLENAVKYSPQGGLVDVSIQIQGGAIRVRVADQGPGIPPEDLPHIFERFYRSASTQKTDGMGLGLAIAKKIADVHGGRLDVSSEPGRGTVFTFEMDRSATT